MKSEKTIEEVAALQRFSSADFGENFKAKAHAGSFLMTLPNFCISDQMVVPIFEYSLVKFYSKEIHE